MKNSLKVERVKQNVTQTELASAIGVSRQTIHAIETGKFSPSLLTAMKISLFFEISVQDIFKLD